MITEDPSFIAIKRFGYDIAKLEERYPDGCPDHVIAAALLIKEEDVQTHYDAVVEKLRGLMGVER
jgi:hypothetical protein